MRMSFLGGSRWNLATIVCLTMLLPSAENKTTSEYRCTYVRKRICAPATCTASPIGTSYLLMAAPEALLEATSNAKDAEALPTVARCDARGCDRVSVWVSQAGTDFIVARQMDGAYMVKIQTTSLGPGVQGTPFLEVATLGFDTYTYWGECAFP